MPALAENRVAVGGANNKLVFAVLFVNFPYNLIFFDREFFNCIFEKNMEKVFEEYMWRAGEYSSSASRMCACGDCSTKIL